MNIEGAQEMSGDSKIVLCDTVMANAWHYAFGKNIECTSPRVNPSVNSGL